MSPHDICFFGISQTFSILIHIMQIKFHQFFYISFKYKFLITSKEISQFA